MESPTQAKVRTPGDGGDSCGLFMMAIFGVVMISATLWKCYHPAFNVPDDYHYTPSPFANDAERLEWRSRMNLPMTDEDVHYEQKKIIDAYKQIKASEQPLGY